MTQEPRSPITVVALGMLAVAAIGAWASYRGSDAIERLQRIAKITFPETFAPQQRRAARAPQRREEALLDSQPLAAARVPWADEGSGDLPPRRAVAVPELDLRRLPPLSDNAAALAGAAAEAAGRGDYDSAIELLEDALASDPEHPLLERNLQTTLLNQGVADLNDDRPEDAVIHLERADTFGDQPTVLRALGAAYQRLSRNSDAVVVLQSALDLDPHDGQTMFFLAQALTEVDRRAEALDLLLRAREAGMQGPMVDRLADRLSREVDAEWDYVRSTTAHFDIDYRDDRDPAVIADIAADLEDAYDYVGGRLGFTPEGRTRAVLYPQEDFHHFTQMPDWIGGLFDGRIKIPVGGLESGSDELSRVIRHEYAHRVINEISGRACPVWLNEGIAMWAEGNDEFREAWALEELSSRQLLDLTTITGPLAALGEQRARTAYAQSYLAVAHLAARYGERRIPELLREIGRLRDIDEASHSVFRANLRDVLATYFAGL